MKKTLLNFAACVLVFGCSEKSTVDPSTNEDTSWVPNMSVFNTGYQRVEIHLDEQPTDEVFANLKSLTVEAQKVGDVQFVVVDSLNILPYVDFSYSTSPVFEQNMNYNVRLSAEYKNGTVNKGNSVSIFSPLVKGKVLKQLDHPQPFAPGHIYVSPDDFGFWQGKMYVQYSYLLVEVDTATGNWDAATYLPSSGIGLPKFTFAQDTLVVANLISLTPRLLELSWVNTADFSEYKKDTIAFNASYSLNDLAFDGTNLRMLVFDEDVDASRLLRLNAQTGEVLDVSQHFQGKLHIVGRNGELWSADSYNFSYYQYPLDNRIGRLDTANFSVLEEHRNPIFISDHLAWDGTHFWNFDREKQMYSKLLLEGI